MAKPFFEKSRLPLDDLRNIWQLADITEDGWLDLNEFRIAMHFVVVRKHGLPIPTDYCDNFGDSRRNSSIERAREQESSKMGRAANCSPVQPNSDMTSTTQPVLDEKELEQLSLSELLPAEGTLTGSAKALSLSSTVPMPSSSKKIVPGLSEKVNLRATQKSSKGERFTKA